MTKLKTSLALFLILTINNVWSGEVISSFVDEVDDHYLIRVEMLVNAKIDDVYKHLSDFKNVHKLNNTIISSIVRFSKGKNHEVEVFTKGCVLFFCSEQIQYQKVSELDHGYIMINLDPKKSDFLSGQILWQVIEKENKTRVIFAADFEPDFWIPPLIGPWILTDVFLNESQETIYELEKLAQKTQLSRKKLNNSIPHNSH